MSKRARHRAEPTPRLRFLLRRWRQYWERAIWEVIND